MENLRNRRYKFNNLRNSISSLDDTSLTGSFSGLGGSDLQTAASGHGGYGSYGHHSGYQTCCENGVDLGTLLALLGGKPEQIFSYLCF